MSRSRRRGRARELLALVGLERSADVPLRRFSKGMVQRAGLAQALVNEPDLVILDEPMSGLDPIGRRLVRDIILGLRRAGKTVFFSTHILSDAEALCDRVGVLRAGRLVRTGSLSDLVRIDVRHMEVFVSGLGEDAAALGTARRERVGERLRVEVDERDLGRTVAAVEAAGGRILSVQPVRETLEDYFFREMGASAGGASAWGEG
jgi:ABC-2 type transport system ATP-binding protein